MQFSDQASLAVIGELLLGGEADTSSFNHEGLFEWLKNGNYISYFPVRIRRQGTRNVKI